MSRFNDIIKNQLCFQGALTGCTEVECPPFGEILTVTAVRGWHRQASRLHLVSASFGDEADGQKLNIRLAGRMDTMRQRCQPIAWSTNHAALHQSPKAQTADPAGGEGISRLSTGPSNR